MIELPEGKEQPRPRVVWPPKKQGLLHGSQLSALGPVLDRVLAFVILGGSFLLSIAAFDGGIRWLPSLRAVAIGVLVQVVLTAGQWVWNPARGLHDRFGRPLPRKERAEVIMQHLSWKYVACVFIGAGLSVLGAMPAIVPSIDRFLVKIGLASAPGSMVVWVIVWILALGIEIIPEVTLVDDD